MKGLWLENQSIQYRDDLPMPVVSNSDALVKVIYAGICGTDIQLTKGYYPFTGIPGHEFVGEVVESKSNPSIVGKRVVGEINIGCGQCDFCQRNLKKHCRNRKVLGLKDYHGAFSEYLVLPVENLHFVPENIPSEQAVLAEPLAAALQIKNQIRFTLESKVLIIGAGRLGYLIAAALCVDVPRLQVVARYPQQIERLKLLNVRVVDESGVDEKAWNVVIEATGSENGMLQAMRAIEPFGTIVLKSTFHGETHLHLAELVVNEINLVGSRCGNFSSALDYLAQYEIDTSFFSKPFAINEWKNAFDCATQGGASKVLFRL